ncbi:MAG: hypothetical protein HC771_14620 [Synechococcales cyanobacterium CRU_2_2]|nr:hypothetical protein [Synechococcales cyanobacterium CRU_2_2]
MHNPNPLAQTVSYNPTNLNIIVGFGDARPPIEINPTLVPGWRTVTIDDLKAAKIDLYGEAITLPSYPETELSVHWLIRHFGSPPAAVQFRQKRD